MRRGAPSADLTLNAFLDLYLARHGATIAPSTAATLTARLKPARNVFGSWKLSELEHASADVAAWRATLPDGSRHRLTLALRQALAAAVRWRYIARNPAVDAGPNPEPRADELRPFTRGDVDALALELGPVYGPLVVFAAETGLRTNEWVALERRDVDRQAVTVQRRYADGRLTLFPKTEASRRRVPLTQRALAAPSTRSPHALTRRCCSRRSEGSISTCGRGGPASGTPRSTPPGSPAAARTACVTRSRPKP